MLRVVALAGIWGCSFLFIKVAGEGLTPPTVAWARIALGATVLQIILRSRGRRPPGAWDVRRKLAVAALVGNATPFTLLAWAELHISSALASVVNASTPLFTALISAAALGERLRPPQLAGLGVGITGVATAAGLGASDLQGSSVAGALAGAGAACCYGTAFVYIRRNLLGVPSTEAAAGQLTAGALLLAPLAAATSVTGGVALTPTRVAAVIMLGAMGTGIAYVLLYRATAELGATRASLVTYLVPVVAVSVGVAVLGEPFGWRLVVGGLLTISGVATVNLTRRPGATGAPAGDGGSDRTATTTAAVGEARGGPGPAGPGPPEPRTPVPHPGDDR